MLTLTAALLPAIAAAQRVEVRLEDRTLGRTIPLHRFEGRLYAAGEPGHRYAIRLTNRTGERVLAVVSVDGVNVVTGQTADPAQSGYVLGPWQSTTINGWRKNMSEIAAFNFAPLPESYAARTGRPGDVGVIGVAVFEEQRWVRPYDDEIALGKRQPSPYPQSQPAPAEPYAGAPAARDQAAGEAASGMIRQRSEDKLGTGHGEREWSYARHTEFQRSTSQPVEVNAIWYDSRRNLALAGILPHPPRWYAGPHDAHPFPGFVPDPY
ncbi:MAG: hypothetical protein DYH17_10680 [Xanthomonadales bacterium PRO6]|nr:hypothetical protein [Xanthomonadales bacterium PRO6]